MARTAFILILMGDPERAERLRTALRDDGGHSCRVSTSLTDALDSIRQRAPDVVVADAELGGESTAPPLADLLDRLARDATLITIGESRAPARPRRITCLVLPSGDDEAALRGSVGRAADAAVRRREDRLLQESLEQAPQESFEGIVGTSAKMREIVERIRRAARNKLTVLVLGETGTGKELIAEAIHRRSDRAARPFLAMNCAGLNESLLESQLFGHVKGAFTGAVSDRKGYFEAAHGGTLFLDEIGDMPFAMQAKLLRALARREFSPVGSTEIRRVVVRFIAATNVDLQRKIEQGGFREDLYYRLTGCIIRVPPLRERREDIPLLAMHLLRRANSNHGLNCPGISGEAMECLSRYLWPGNVRELTNVIEAAAAEAETRAIELHDLPERIRGPRDLVPVSSGGLVGLTMAQVERMMIERTLQATSGNREQAAKMLDIGTRTLYRKIKEYGLS